MAQTLPQEVETPILKSTVNAYKNQIDSIETTLTSIKNGLIAVQVKTGLDADGFPALNVTDAEATVLIAGLTTIIADWPL